MPKNDVEKKVEPQLGKKSAPIKINVNAALLIRNLFFFCIFFEIFLFLIDAVVNYGRLTEISALRGLCNIAREDGLASWFMTTQTFMTGLTLWLIFLVSKKSSMPKKTIAGWCILAIFFTYMAVDDGAQIHERLGSTFEAIYNVESSQGTSSSWGTQILEIYPSYPWQLLFVPFLAAIGLFMLLFLWRELSERSAKVLIVVAIICLAAAVCLDFLEGLDDNNHALNLYAWTGDQVNLNLTAIRHFSKSLEEFIEMLGMTIFFVTFIKHFIRLASNKLLVSFS